MKLMVDVSEKDWKFMQKTYKETGLSFVSSEIKNECVKAVYNGTPYEERKMGKWIVQPSPFYKNTTIYICPFCKSQYEQNSWAVPKFCQDCGMKSIGIDETHKYAGWTKIYEDYPNES